MQALYGNNLNPGITEETAMIEWLIAIHHSGCGPARNRLEAAANRLGIHPVAR
jgi:hypothetical protein